MMRTLLRGSSITLAAFFVGCAQEGEVAEQTPQVAEQAQVPVGETPVRQAEPVVLAQYRTLAVPTFEMRPMASWKLETRSAFEVFTAPGGQARVLVTPFGENDSMTAMRDAALELLEGTEIRPAEQRNIQVGEGQLEAEAQDGALKLPTGEAGFQCAVIKDRSGRKVFVAYVFGKDAPAGVREDGMRMIGSLRDK